MTAPLFTCKNTGPASSRNAHLFACPAMWLLVPDHHPLLGHLLPATPTDILDNPRRVLFDCLEASAIQEKVATTYLRRTIPFANSPLFVNFLMIQQHRCPKLEHPACEEHDSKVLFELSKACTVDNQNLTGWAQHWQPWLSSSAASVCD